MQVGFHTQNQKKKKMYAEISVNKTSNRSSDRVELFKGSIQLFSS